MNMSSQSVFAVTCNYCIGFDFYLDEEKTEQDRSIYNEFNSTIKDHFDCDRESLSNGYANYNFSKYFKEVDKCETVTYTPCTVYEIVKYVKTFSAYNTLIEKNKDNKSFSDPA